LVYFFIVKIMKVLPTLFACGSLGLGVFFCFGFERPRVPWKFELSLRIALAISVLNYFCTHYIIRTLKPLLIKVLFGHDAHKDDRPKTPESLGLAVGISYLGTLVLLTPAVFGTTPLMSVTNQEFKYLTLTSFLSALLSINAMLLLGFVDDVLELKWRHKIYLPTLATIPILTVYFVSGSSTYVLVPGIIQDYVGRESINLSFFFYIYMGTLAVFCTNAVNILAGINGLEVGQSLIIACFIVLFNFVQLQGRDPVDKHLFSIYFMFPFISSSAALLQHNWCPASAFVGDTYCYFSGMCFAAVGILGHFPKTLILFWIMQFLNFVFSTPQLFRIIPCPRHRMPLYNKETKLLEPSWCEITGYEKKPLSRFVISLFEYLTLVEFRTREVKGHEIREMTNQTVIILALVKLGPMSEKKNHMSSARSADDALCFGILVSYALGEFVT